MKNNSIVVSGHVPKYDPQGNLTADEKLEMFSLSLKHLRQMNPDAYIAFTGHGVRKPDMQYCDWFYWEETCRPLDHNGYVANMPAQYYFMGVGLEHILDKGFSKCLKTRADCIIQRPHITEWCDNILDEEEKLMLLTQQTGEMRIGDCFMYGLTKDLLHIWNKDLPPDHQDGLLHTGKRFAKTFNWRGEPWKEFIKRICAFRDVIDISFLCLRWNWHNLNKDSILQYGLDPMKYHWGKANGWHSFDGLGNGTSYNSDLWTRKEFYE